MTNAKTASDKEPPVDNPEILWALLTSRNKLVEDLLTIAGLPEPLYQKMSQMVDDNHSQDKEIFRTGGK